MVWQWLLDVSHHKKQKCNHLKMDSLVDQMEAFKTPLVIFIILALLAVIVYLYVNRRAENISIEYASTMSQPIEPVSVREKTSLKNLVHGTVGADRGSDSTATFTGQEDVGQEVGKERICVQQGGTTFCQELRNANVRHGVQGAFMPISSN